MNREIRRQIMEVYTILAKQEDLRVNLDHSVRNATAIGISSLIGSFVFGRVGLIGGAVLSSVATGISTRNSYRPAWEIIRDLSQNEQDALIEALRRIRGSADLNDFATWVNLAFTVSSVRSTILRELIGVLQNQLNYQIVS